MKHKYIGVKMVEAEPMDQKEWLDHKHGLSDEHVPMPGYKVTYPDGYVSWCPAATFEAANFPVEFMDKMAGDDVLNFLNNDKTLLSKLGEKTAVVQATCLSGFEITETAACVNVEGFDMNIGQRLAAEKIYNRLWGYLGFVLQWARNGLVHEEDENTTQENEDG